jgi:SAM-dependent methyltransferase
MPFRDNSADRLYCFGVLQHTPEPEETFRCLVEKIKPGGHFAADIYALRKRTLFWSKYWVRPLTKRLGDNERAYRAIQTYVDLMWPVVRLNMRVFPNWFGRKINWQLLVPDYSEYDLTEEQLKEWAYLDCFDMLTPAHDHPASLRTFRRWFAEHGVIDADVHYGYNGIEGRGVKAKS